MPLGEHSRLPSPKEPAVPLKAKGDILSRTNRALERLAVGTDGHVLKANSATATGLQWAALAAATITVQGNDVTVDANASTLDFSSRFSVSSSPAGEANITLATRTRSMFLPAMAGHGLDHATPAQLGSTAQTSIMGWQMSDATNNSVLYTLNVPQDYASGGTWKIYMAGNSTATGSGSILLDIHYLTLATTGSLNATAEASSTGNSLSITQGSGVHQLSTASVDLSTGLAAGDLVRFCLIRDGAGVGDNYADNVYNLGIRFDYTADS